MKTKTKFITFNNQEFDSAAEAEEYEKKNIDGKIHWEYIWRSNKIFPYKHDKDTQEKEHCVISGQLCNIYEIGTSPHNGDYYRGPLKEKVSPSVKIFERCISSKITDKFLEELDNLIKSLK